MYTLGKLKHQRKSFSPLSEFKQEKVLLAVERVQARESPPRLERVQARTD